MQNNFFATNLKFLRTKKGLEQVAMIAKLASKKFKPRNFKETKEP